MTDKIAVLEKPNANNVHIDAAVSVDEQWEVVLVFPNLDARDDFLESVAKFESTGSTRAMRPFCAKFIRKWPYADLDPTKVEDYGKLNPPDLFEKEIIPRLVKALEAFRR